MCVSVRVRATVARWAATGREKVRVGLGLRVWRKRDRQGEIG
jgi:hypothetical protein